MEITDFYLTLYDFVTIADGPDEGAAAQIEQSRRRTETVKTFPVAEDGELIDGLP